MKILVYEHVSGGVFAGQSLDPNVLSEGFGMLRCLAQDFKAAGHDVTVLLDARLSKLNPPIAADCIVPVFYAREAEKFLVGAAKINDAVYVIAPETGRTLQSLVTLVGKTGKLSLNCEAKAIQVVADKALLYETLKQNGLHIPETVVFDVDFGLSEVKSEIGRRLSYPVVFKPADGVSCGGLSIVKEETHIESAVAKIKAASSGKHLVVQEFIRGEAASVSLLSTGSEARPISLNMQSIQLAEPGEASSYEGGAVPFDHPLKKEAFLAAETVARSIPGLLGYVGVNLVLAEDKAFVVDVNPRLTTSYVGLSRVAGFNVAEAIVDAVLNNKLPTIQKNKDFAQFSKVKSSKPSLNAFQKVARIDGIISPPFPLDKHSEAVSLVAGYGESMAEAQFGFEEAKKRLLNIISRGK